MALIDDTFLRTVDDLMPCPIVCIKNVATVVGRAGYAEAPVLSQYEMNSNMSALYARNVFGAYAPSK